MYKGWIIILIGSSNFLKDFQESFWTNQENIRKNKELVSTVIWDFVYFAIFYLNEYQVKQN
jgi:hypothetical protein